MRARLIVSTIALLGCAVGAFADCDAEQLIRGLDGEHAAEHVDRLVRRGEAVVPRLIEAVDQSEVLSVRGWAIVALSRIGTPDAKKALARVVKNDRVPLIVQRWAGAGRIAAASTLDELIRLATNQRLYPSLQGVLRERALDLADSNDIGSLLRVAHLDPQLKGLVTDVIMSRGPQGLTNAMLRAKNASVRQLAAGYLASLGKRDGPEIATLVVQAYAFDARAKSVPWRGGPLYIPALDWHPSDARRLLVHLARWHEWAVKHKNRVDAHTVLNTLQSRTLIRAAGLSMPQWRADNGPLLKMLEELR